MADRGGAHGPDALRVLEEERRWLHAQDPDTHRQWQYLRNSLAAQPVTSRRSTAPRYAVALRPILVAGIIATAVGVLAILHRSSPEKSLTYLTGKGEMSTVQLADSSTVILNHTSELIVEQHSADEPRVVRLKGEAFFQVKQTGTPFIVQSASGSVEVLGTSFNVRDRRGRLEVAVRTGTVRVQIQQEGTEQMTVLPAGMMLTAAPGGSPAKPEPIMLEDYPGWLHGRLTFQRAPMTLVCEELEARFNITVRIDHPTLPAEHISGVLDSRTAESALRTLAQLTSLRIRHDGTAFVLY